QHAEFGEPDATGERRVTGLKVTQPGSLDPQAFDQSVRDITAFLEYAGEPAALKRQSMGVWVILFLAAFTFLAWLLKKEYWRDVNYAIPVQRPARMCGLCHAEPVAPVPSGRPTRGRDDRPRWVGGVLRPADSGCWRGRWWR